MKLYNTLSRAVEEVQPLEDNTVKVYTCGLTVYSQPHIGNWVAYIYWDILVRALKASGLRVIRVQNITDVGHLTSDEDAGEDKMLKGAIKEGLTAWQVAEKYIHIAEQEAYIDLGLIRPDHMPRATEFIDQQIAFVKDLEEKGYTYRIADGVYFDTSKLSDYGKLARLDIDGLQFGVRVADTGKKNPTDFALWKFSAPQEKRDMEWWAPWTRPGVTNDEKHVVGAPRTMHSNILRGDDEHHSKSYYNTTKREAESATKQDVESAGSVVGSAGEQAGTVHGSWGFPGWHLECSVMARELLGDTIDIHTGGIDHIPVHHTNEIAQSEALTGKEFSKLWVHANHLKVDGTKISKSLGNGYTLNDITEKGYSLEAFKLLVISKHYRTEGNFTWEILEAAANRLRGFEAWADLMFQPSAHAADLGAKYFKDMSEKLRSALLNDLATPEALAIISEAVEAVDKAGGIKNEHLSSFIDFLKYIDSLLGLSLSQRADISEEEKKLMSDRTTARSNKNWAESDRLRSELENHKIGIRDTAHGTVWNRL